MSTIVVTGSVRCGSSLTMRMLDSCGIPIIQENFKQPDQYNPYGYYETRGVYFIQNGNFEVLNNSNGKAIKILPPTILSHLPSNMYFKTIFLSRDPTEVGKSFYRYHLHQSTLRGNPIRQTEDQYLSHFIPDHLDRIRVAKEWISSHSNFDILWVEHHTLMTNPLSQTQRICDFLSKDFPNFNYDPQQMASLVDINLYRQRS